VQIPQVSVRKQIPPHPKGDIHEKRNVSYFLTCFLVLQKSLFLHLAIDNSGINCEPKAQCNSGGLFLPTVDVIHITSLLNAENCRKWSVAIILCPAGSNFLLACGK